MTENNSANAHLDLYRPWLTRMESSEVGGKAGIISCDAVNISRHPLTPDPKNFYRSLPVIPQAMIDYLLDRGVEPLGLGSGANWPLKGARGVCASDGWFDPVEFGSACYAVPIDDGDGVIDVAFWDARTGDTGRLLKCGFALGEEQINNPGTCSLGGHLKIHASPLDWLRSGREGIFVLDWSRAFDRLRYCPRVAVHQSVLSAYRSAMKSPHLPRLFVMTDDKEAA